MKAQLQRYGERGYLICGLNPGERGRVEAALDRQPPRGFREYVLGHDTMLLRFSGPESLAGLECWLDGVPGSVEPEQPEGRLLEVPVVYRGVDLARVAQLTGLSESEVVAIHSAPEYRVRMMGFAPGFPYLDGLDPRLHLDRRGSPRNQIAPGSVAIGGAHAGIYSVASPGGWHILGHTELRLFRPELACGSAIDPRAVFAFAPGDRVQFIAKEDDDAADS